MVVASSTHPDEPVWVFRIGDAWFLDGELR